MGKFLFGVFLACAVAGAVMYYIGSGTLAFVLSLAVAVMYSLLIPMGSEPKTSARPIKRGEVDTGAGTWIGNVPDHVEDKPVPPSHTQRDLWYKVVEPDLDAIEKRLQSERLYASEYQPGVQVPLKPVEMQESNRWG